MVDFTIVPQKTALINVDMQNCFVAGSQISAPDGVAVLARINLLAKVCRLARILVIHTAFVLRPDGSNIGVLADTSPPAKEGILNKGSESAALNPRLLVEAKDIVLEKPRFGAFHGTDLELILRSRGIDTIIISGNATNVCCETTAREAMVRDFHVFFLIDGTASVGLGGATADELQRATIANLGSLFAQVLTVDEMLKKIEQSVGSSAV
jgi:ureidoacrylate peracid hydrolase